MARFIDDLAGAIYDFFKFIFKCICYLLAGMLIVGIPLYLIALAFKTFHLSNVQTKNTICFTQSLTPFTKEGREQIYKNLHKNIKQEITLLMESTILTRSVEYMDNRISRYSMKKGICEITGSFLQAQEVHCHHYIPLHLGGTDKFNNLRILHKDVHKVIHMTDTIKINTLMKNLDITQPMLEKINKYRENVN
jgi:RNA-directed DNA polymerase